LPGIILTPATVMACAEQVDGSADRLADALAEELGEDGWHEGSRRRNLRYVNLLHLIGAVHQPRELVDWAAAHRRRRMGATTASIATLARYELVDEPGARGMRPVVLRQAPLGGCGATG
jgi:hypothetical protein